MAKVAVLDDYQGVALEMADWRALGPAVDVQVFRDHLKDEDRLADRLAPFHAIVAMRERTPFPTRLLERLPALRLLVTTGAANASIDLDGATRLGILVCGTRGLKYPTAELTWGLILALTRHIPREDQATRRGHWQTTLGVGLQGKTLGVIGLGTLGSQVAAIGRAFGMPVIAWSQHLTAERAAECGAALVSKEGLLRQADVVTIHLKLSDRTQGLLGPRELALMKPTAFLVNTSRGPIVDEGALVEALRRGAVAGAALDVYDDEPLPPDHPLRRLENTVITPHLGYVTREGYEVFYRDAVEDVRAFFDGHPVRALNPDVTSSPGYRGSRR
ncbi:MAG: D-2-hydroxyacid dehydrogenase family protein [Bacillati bacterium ANGP1]|uniref:D-2-hydroxyacid dehydrogenase family protein n=1 Tax=Candidatus Segetimicrobium genomatis TaxID=2569760 RepID=A0A537K2S2_9BACT|nr:MAG: D-2-hydroxyacid dehydrogenase family protein [Terrabacteria group bacterium ANGP1]